MCRPAICAVLLTMLVACAPSGSGTQCDPNKPKPNLQNFPLYPSAQQVTAQDLGGGVPRKLITYEVNDSPDNVTAFYTKVLEQGGWEKTQQSPSSLALDYYWRNYCAYPEYWLLATIQSENAGKSSVRLDIRTMYRE